MHRLVLLLVAFFVISISTVAFAKSDNANSNSGRGQGQSQSQGSSNRQSENRGQSSNHGPSAQAQVAAREATPSAVCDPNANWKNHGEYVSCVARLHLGGQTTSQAARSDIGKKKGSTPSASLSPSPSASASATPEATATASPEATSSATVSIPEAIANEAKGLINNIVSLLARLQELLSL